MAAIHTATGAPRLLVLGEEKFLLSPLGPLDLAEILTWLEAEPYRHARAKLDALGNAITDDERQAILVTADEQAETICSNAKGALQVFDALEEGMSGRAIAGFAKVVMIMLREKQPDIDEQTVRRLVSVPDNMPRIMDAIAETSSVLGKSPPRRPRARSPRGKKSR